MRPAGPALAFPVVTLMLPLPLTAEREIMEMPLLATLSRGRVSSNSAPVVDAAMPRVALMVMAARLLPDSACSSAAVAVCSEALAACSARVLPLCTPASMVTVPAAILKEDDDANVAPTTSSASDGCKSSAERLPLMMAERRCTAPAGVVGKDERFDPAMRRSAPGKPPAAGLPLARSMLPLAASPPLPEKRPTLPDDDAATAEPELMSTVPLPPPPPPLNALATLTLPEPARPAPDVNRSAPPVAAGAAPAFATRSPPAAAAPAAPTSKERGPASPAVDAPLATRTAPEVVPRPLPTVMPPLRPAELSPERMSTDPESLVSVEPAYAPSDAVLMCKLPLARAELGAKVNRR